jgi:hypothetical protein
MEAVLNLKPGTYNLNLLLADQGHIPYFVFSKPMKITVVRQTTTPAAEVQGPRRVEVLEPQDGAAVKGPFRVQFHASGYNIAHAAAQVPDSNHFRLTMEGKGKPEVLNFTEGQTEAWIDPPIGAYTLKLDLVDNLKGTVVSSAKPLRITNSSSRVTKL